MVIVIGVYQEYGGIGGNKSLSDIGVIMADDLNAYQAMICGTLLFENEELISQQPDGVLTSEFVSQYFTNKVVYWVHFK